MEEGRRFASDLFPEEEEAMISTRQALLRGTQSYFHARLLGVVHWDDVKVDKAIPIPAIRGKRDQGPVRDLVVLRFGGFKMEVAGPFDDEKWPLGRVSVSRGPWSVEGPFDPLTWDRIAEFIKDQKDQGEDDGDIAGGENWGR